MATAVAKPALAAQLQIAGILLCILGALGAIESVGAMVAPPPPVPQMADPQMQAAARRGQAAAGMAASPLVLIWYLVMAVGGAAMIRREYWGLALTGALLSLVPCSVVFCLSFPVGIWSLVILSLPGVKASFANPRRRR